jgi:hypothetical protein
VSDAGHMGFVAGPASTGPSPRCDSVRRPVATRPARRTPHWNRVPRRVPGPGTARAVGFEEARRSFDAGVTPVAGPVPVRGPSVSCKVDPTRGRERITKYEADRRRI